MADQKLTNEALDGHVVRLIRAEEKACSNIATTLNEPDRAIDRSLQRLKRKGLIAFHGPTRKWRLVTS